MIETDGRTDGRDQLSFIYLRSTQVKSRIFHLSTSELMCASEGGWADAANPKLNIYCRCPSDMNAAAQPAFLKPVPL